MFRKCCQNCGCDPYKHTGYGIWDDNWNATNALEMAEEKRRKEEAAERKRRMKEEEERLRLQKEAEEEERRRKKAAEEEARRRKKAADEAARKKREAEEEAARKKREAEEAARRKKEAEDEAKRIAAMRAAEREKAKREAEDRRRREEEERKRREAAEEAARKKRKAEEEAARKKREAEEEAARRRKAAEEEAERRRKEAEEKRLLDLLNGLTWVPEHTNEVGAQNILDWVKTLPHEQQPTQGNNEHDGLRNRQRPNYDMDLNECCDINKNDRAAQAAFKELDKKRTAARCHPQLRRNARGQYEVVVPELGNQVFPSDGIKCVVCSELIIDHLVYKHGDPPQPYCQRHWAEANGKHRCAACDELIFGGKVTKVQEDPSIPMQYYHVQHFCCFKCDKQLGGEKYWRDDEQRLLCKDCYQEDSGVCPGCGLPCLSGDIFEGVGPNQDENWHAECYKCCECQKTFATMMVAEDNGKLYCRQHIGNHPVVKPGTKHKSPGCPPCAPGQAAPSGRAAPAPQAAPAGRAAPAPQAAPAGRAAPVPQAAPAGRAADRDIRTAARESYGQAGSGLAAPLRNGSISKGEGHLSQPAFARGKSHVELNPSKGSGFDKIKRDMELEAEVDEQEAAASYAKAEAEAAKAEAAKYRQEAAQAKKDRDMQRKLDDDRKRVESERNGKAKAKPKQPEKAADGPACACVIS